MHQNNTGFVSQLLFHEEQVTINIVWTVSVMLDLKWSFQPKNKHIVPLPPRLRLSIEEVQV